MFSSYSSSKSTFLNMDATSTTSTEKEVIADMDATTYAIITTAMVLIALWMLIANSLIITARLVHKPLRYKAYTFISSLAAADLLSAITITISFVMQSMSIFNPSWFKAHKTNGYCQFVLFGFIFPVLCSFSSMLLIAVDRLVAVLYPFKYKTLLNKTACWLLIMSAWMVALGVSLINFGWNRDYGTGELECWILDIAPLYFHAVYGTYFWLITASLVIIYVIVYFALRKSKRMIQSQLQGNSSGNNDGVTASEKRVVKLAILTLGIFLLCWTPFVVTSHLVVDLRISLSVTKPAFILAFLNSGMNFFIYAAICKDYRAAFKILCPCTCRKPNAVANTEACETSFTQ